MGQQSEDFKIGRGIASHKLNDHYAVLGLPLTTDANLIRKKFLKLVKVLHPDVFGRTDAEKELATKYFSKMVSPAYQILNSDRERSEYLVTLRLLAQSLKQKSVQLAPQSEIAKKLLKYPHETIYTKFVTEVAELQYQSLDKSMDYTADLSELNLVYLFTQEAVDIAPAPAKNASNIADTMPKPATTSPALRNIQLAELFINKKQWADALKELRAGEKLDANNAKIHALLGVIHMNQNAGIMAKSSFQKALKLDPKEPTALKYINQVSNQTETKTPPKKEEKKGGLFGWGKK